MASSSGIATLLDVDSSALGAVPAPWYMPPRLIDSIDSAIVYLNKSLPPTVRPYISSVVVYDRPSNRVYNLAKVQGINGVFSRDATFPIQVPAGYKDGADFVQQMADSQMLREQMRFPTLAEIQRSQSRVEMTRFMEHALKLAKPPAGPPAPVRHSSALLSFVDASLPRPSVVKR